MPYKRSPELKKCRWCENPAKQWKDKTGRFKCYQRTCGSAECIKASYKDKAVNQKKRFHQIRICETCSKEYEAKSHTARWCRPCAPDVITQSRIRRYGINKNWWDETFSKQNGMCAMCKEKAAICLDHNHTNGKIRGILCSGCNYGLSFIENNKFKELAENYLNEMEKVNV